MIWFALALLALGAIVGGRGLRVLTRTVRGPWRPGAGVLGVVAVFAALALAARAQWIAGAVLLAVGAAMLAAARAPRPAIRRPAAPPPPGGDRRDAAQILGVSVDAAAEEVDAAYRRLMRMAHPDVGGTAGLAAKLNAARTTLLRR